MSHDAVAEVETVAVPKGKPSGIKHVGLVEIEGQTFWSISNRVLQEIHEALTELAARRLEKREHHDGVVALIRNWFEDPMQNINDAITQIVDDNPAPEGWEGADLPVAVNEARGREVNKLMKEHQLIAPIPKTKLLTKDHLPKPIKDVLGDRNQFGVGTIQTKLHFVYPLPTDIAEKIEDGEDGTREGD